VVRRLEVLAGLHEENDMTKTEMKSYERRLLALKKRMAGELTDLEQEALRAVGGEASGDLSNVPFHPADLGSDNFEEEMALRMMENQQEILADVLDALDRIQQGTFGRCEECGQEIPKRRLDAVPYTRYCLRHAKEFQSRPAT
jgi:DnaK suppressor protein